MNNNIIELELPKVNYYVSDLQDKYNNGLLKDQPFRCYTIYTTILL